MKMNVYDFCMASYKVNSITLDAHQWNEDDSFTFIHKVWTDKFDSEIYKYKDFEIIQFKVTKRNALEIIACRDLRKEH